MIPLRKVFFDENNLKNLLIFNKLQTVKIMHERFRSRVNH